LTQSCPRAKQLRWVAWLLLSLGLGACGGEHPQLTPLPPDAVILAFGDSLTRGTGAAEASTYPSELARLTGFTVVNAGIPGEISADGLRRLPAVLDANKPQLMILCHGGNDMLRKRNLAAAADHIGQMIELARARGTEVVLVGVPKPGLLLGTADFYAELATSANVPLESDIVADVLGNAGLKSDPIHPNAAGYRQIAAALFELLGETGAL